MNITFKKIYRDVHLTEIRIEADCEYVSAYQNCYVSDKFLKEAGDILIKYSYDYKEAYYLEFGNKKGNYSPAFSLKLFPADRCGNLNIEVDLEVPDDDTRCHRCIFYVETQIGLVEQFGKKLKKLASADVGKKISLHQ